MSSASDLKDLVEKCGLVPILQELAILCGNKAREDENLVVQEYHDQWMAARIELFRCAETIIKGGE